MKFSLSCSADSKIFIDNKEIEFEFNGKNFIFTPNNEGILEKITIITKVDEPEKFYSKVIEGDKTRPHEMIINADAKIYQDIISDFQYIESNLGFGGNLKNIHWENPEQEWIPETDEEKFNTQILKFSLGGTYPEKESIVTTDTLMGIIKDRVFYDKLTVLKSFYREGKNFFQDFRFIDAFYQFYFILEDIYGEGKTKNAQIEENFKKSTELKGTIEWAVKNHLNNGRHNINLKNFLTSENLTYDVDGIIEFLIRIRGRLHHYSSKSTKITGTPLNQRDFETVAFMCLGISYMSILLQILKINQERGIAEV